MFLLISSMMEEAIYPSSAMETYTSVSSLEMASSHDEQS